MSILLVGMLNEQLLLVEIVTRCSLLLNIDPQLTSLRANVDKVYCSTYSSRRRFKITIQPKSVMKC